MEKKMSCQNPLFKQAIAELRSHSFATTKFAEIGSEKSFEQAFSNVAHMYLQEKAPLLQDYEVGFQLVEKSEDNERAIGVFGFKIGDQWVYAPVFFINGDLKGHELMYLKNQ